MSVYDGGDFYGYGRRGEVSLHLSRVERVDPKTTLVSVYLYVDPDGNLLRYGSPLAAP